MNEIVFVSSGDGRLGMMAELLLKRKYSEHAISFGTKAEPCAPFKSKIDEEFLNAQGCTSRESWQRALQPGFIMAASQLILISECDFYGEHTTDLPHYIDTANKNVSVWEVPEQDGTYDSYQETYRLIRDNLQGNFGEEPFVTVPTGSETPAVHEEYTEVA